jgi:amidase
VEAAIECIERHNPKLNAVVFKAYDEARAKTKAKLSGIFAGVPMLLKDILGAKKGWPTRSGSRFLPVAPSPFDATIVARFETANGADSNRTFPRAARATRERQNRTDRRG